MQEEFIIKLIETFNSSSITSLQLQKDNTSISLQKGQNNHSDFVVSDEKVKATQSVIKSEITNTTVKTADSTKSSNDSLIDIKSPIVGTFYRSPSPDSLAYAEVGKTIQKGQPICILEAMKMMNTLEAEFDCVVEEVLVTNGDLVEFDQPIFRVKKI